MSRTAASNNGRQSGSARAVAAEGLGEELQRDLLIELHVMGAVDLAHPAAAEQAEDAVAPADGRTDLEPALDEAGGGCHRLRGVRRQEGPAGAARGRSINEIRPAGGALQHRRIDCKTRRKGGSPFDSTVTLRRLSEVVTVTEAVTLFGSPACRAPTPSVIARTPATTTPETHRVIVSSRGTPRHTPPRLPATTPGAVNASHLIVPLVFAPFATVDGTALGSA